MTTTPSSPGAPITDKRQLVEYLESGCKPPSAWRVGTEHEKFVFRRSDLRRIPYDGPDGIAMVLREMTRFGWEPIIENGNTIALSNDARCSITLEPGGQFELSGAPLETVHQTCDEVHELSVKSGKFATSSGLECWGSVSTRNGVAERYRGCRNSVTGSCATTCRRRAVSAST